MTLDEVTKLGTLSSTHSRVESYMEQGKEVGYIFFDIMDFHELQQTHGEDAVNRLLSHIGETVTEQRGRLCREDDCIVVDLNHPGRFVLLLLSPPRRKSCFSDTDLKLVSTRILQKLKMIVQEHSSYHEVADHVYFNSGYTIIKSSCGLEPDRLLAEAHRDASLQAHLERIMANLISNISHELRTPLTCIKGYAESLLEGAMFDDGLCVKFIKIISDEAHRLERLINDLLDISMIDARQVQMLCHETDICELIKKVHAIMQPYTKKSGVSVSYSIPEKPLMLDIDEDRIRQVLIILIDNAVKYSNDGGSVSVSLKKTDRETLISVEDNGMGIPETEKDRIFERFYRVEPKKSLKKEGRGLGLSIAKFIVEAHGGNITVDSTYGKGSTFTLHLSAPIIDET